MRSSSTWCDSSPEPRCDAPCYAPCDAPRTAHQVREMAETHDPGALLDCMRAYHFGPKFLVEVEIVMANPQPQPLILPLTHKP